MEFLIEYLKRNTKYAAKNVFLKFKEYIPFFAAIFIIECVFFTIFITTATNARNIEEELSTQFDYDIVVTGLTENESVALKNSLYYPSIKKTRAFDEYWVKQAPENEGGDYRLYINMREGKDHTLFLADYIDPYLSSSNNSVELSPLYEYEISSNILSESPGILLVIVMCLISVLAISAIYSVRVNNQKFMYGIYITFGANLKKLVSTAVFEMMLIGVLTFIPAAAITYLFSHLAYLPFGISPLFKAGSIIKVLLCILLISILSSYVPMKLTSKKPPIELIVSSDNSNHVISPRGSFDLLGKKYPKHYETLSFWRFRKYYAKLILSSVIFTSIFICGFYISDMYDLNNTKEIYEYSLTAQTSKLSEAERENNINYLYSEITAIDGVSGMTWNVDAPATELQSFLLAKQKDVRKSRGVMADISKAEILSPEMKLCIDDFRDDKYKLATNAFKYSCFDENMIDYISEHFEVVGDPYKILTSPNYVIVSENIYNERCLDFSVGDEIVVAKHIDTLAPLESDLFDRLGVIKHLVEKTYCEFEVYTVAAVIKDYPDSVGTFTVGMNESEFVYMTMREPTPSEASIYLDASVDMEKAADIDYKINSIMLNVGDEYNLHRNYETVDRKIATEKNQTVFAIMISFLVLIMSPVVWFFSQNSFIEKRDKELYVLRAFGALESQISKMFSRSGSILAVLGFVVATLMSLPASYLIYMLFNTWLPSLGIISNDIMYKFYISPIALILCAIVSASSGYFASMIPYKLSQRKLNKLTIKNNCEGDKN